MVVTSSKLLLLIAALAFLTSCSPVNMSGSPAAEKTAPAPTQTTTNSSNSPLILGEIPFSDITKLEFKAVLDTAMVGTFTSNVGITLNHVQSSFASTVKFTGPTAATTIGSCNIKGTGGDFSKLRDSLEKTTLSTGTSNTASPAILSAELKIYLKNGSVRTFEISNNTDSVSGDVEIDAPDLRDQLTSLALESSCSSNIDFF